MGRSSSPAYCWWCFSCNLVDRHEETRCCCLSTEARQHATRIAAFFQPFPTCFKFNVEDGDGSVEIIATKILSWWYTYKSLCNANPRRLCHFLDLFLQYFSPGSSRRSTISIYSTISRNFVHILVVPRSAPPSPTTRNFPYFQTFHNMA